MSDSPMMRQMMGADTSDELAKLVLDEFSFKIRAAAESSREGLSARDIEGLIDDFMEKGRDKTLIHFQERFEAILRSTSAISGIVPVRALLNACLFSGSAIYSRWRGNWTRRPDWCHAGSSPVS